MSKNICEICDREIIQLNDDGGFMSNVLCRECVNDKINGGKQK